MNENIKKWYLTEYPTDEAGEDINDDVTFADVVSALDKHKDVYDVLGDYADSIIRERVFEKLAEILNCDYDVIYNQWLLTED